MRGMLKEINRGSSNKSAFYARATLAAPFAWAGTLLLLALLPAAIVGIGLLWIAMGILPDYPEKPPSYDSTPDHSR